MQPPTKIKPGTPELPLPRLHCKKKNEEYEMNSMTYKPPVRYRYCCTILLSVLLRELHLIIEILFIVHVHPRRKKNIYNKCVLSFLIRTRHRFAGELFQRNLLYNDICIGRCRGYSIIDIVVM